MQTLTDRQQRALQLRRDGKKFTEIGRALDVSRWRASRIVERALIIAGQSEWAGGLQARYVRVLMSQGIKSMAELRSAMESGALKRIPRLGDKSYAAICEWISHQ